MKGEGVGVGEGVGGGDLVEEVMIEDGLQRMPLDKNFEVLPAEAHAHLRQAKDEGEGEG